MNRSKNTEDNKLYTGDEMLSCVPTVLVSRTVAQILRHAQV